MNYYSLTPQRALSQSIADNSALQEKVSGDGFSKNKAQFTSQKSHPNYLSGKNRERSALPRPLQKKAQATFGEDFSNLVVHTSSSKALNMGALAYAQGENIHFASGQFNPTSKKGQEIIGHEIAHVQQQRQNRVAPTLQTKQGDINDSAVLENDADKKGKVFANSSLSSPIRETSKSNVKSPSNAPIQMLKKTPYPWTGAVINTSLLALRDTANGITIADLPRKTLVTVGNTSGNWLNITVDTTQPGVTLNQKGKSKLNGSMVSGYSGHTYIDDAAAAEMKGMLGKSASWTPSSPGSNNTFEAWASAATEGAAPPIANVTTINCWEMVLLAAYRIGAINWTWINNLYTNTTGNWGRQLPTRLTSGALTTYNAATSSNLRRGDLVFFDGAAHVTIATGKGDEVMTFWPPPNITNYTRGTVDDVKISSITLLSNWMTANMSTPVVQFAPPAW